MFSLVLQLPQRLANKAVFVQYLMALAVVEALRPCVQLCIKWPNDIYADVGVQQAERYRKVGGILVNSLLSAGKLTLVVGM